MAFDDAHGVSLPNTKLAPTVRRESSADADGRPIDNTREYIAARHPAQVTIGMQSRMELMIMFCEADDPAACVADGVLCQEIGYKYKATNWSERCVWSWHCNNGKLVAGGKRE